MANHHTATKKFNFPKKTAYLELPRAFFGKSKAKEVSSFEGLPLFARFLLALIHTFNKIEGAPAKLKYDFIHSYIGGSPETISKYKKLLIDKGIIEEPERSCYKIIVPYAPKPFDKVKKCLFEEIEKVINGETENIKLSRKAILILTFIENMEKKGEFYCLQVRLGVAVNMPKSTAGDGVREAVRHSLLTCSTPKNPAKRKANLTKYEVDAELKDVKYIEPKEGEPELVPVKLTFRQEQNREPQEQKPGTRYKQYEEPERKLKTLIERHYFDLRHEAEERADRVYERALADSVYGGIVKQLNELSITIAFAELKDPQKAQELEAQRVALDIKGDKRLRALGINKDDFKPHYKCRVCSDTGYDKNGASCGCLKKFLKTIK